MIIFASGATAIREMADMGQMYEVFIELSIHLRVNLIGYSEFSYCVSSFKI
jgi:hypothetical protein